MKVKFDFAEEVTHPVKWFPLPASFYQATYSVFTLLSWLSKYLANYSSLSHRKWTQLKNDRNVKRWPWVHSLHGLTTCPAIGTSTLVEFLPHCWMHRAVVKQLPSRQNFLWPTVIYKLVPPQVPSTRWGRDSNWMLAGPSLGSMPAVRILEKKVFKYLVI